MRLQKFYPPLELRPFADDVTALLMGTNTEVAEMAKKVMRKLKEEVGERAQNCRSLRMERKERVR